MAEQRPQFNVVTSRLVLDEAALGDADAARRRLAMLADVPILDPNPDVEAVANEILAQALMPQSAKLDASHAPTFGTTRPLECHNLQNLMPRTLLQPPSPVYNSF